MELLVNYIARTSSTVWRDPNTIWSMLMKIVEDTRELTWPELENDIQRRGEWKDPDFVLDGKWKEFVRDQEGFKVYAVDGSWVRNNLSVIFGHGGHGLVHEFIPMDEIWISTNHYPSCKHHGVGEVSEAYFDSCTAHEIKEFQEMEKGKDFWEAHNIALELERKLGLIPEKDI